jgi:large subunit ribosomal protein L21
MFGKFYRNRYFCTPFLEKTVLITNNMYAIVEIAGQQFKVEEGQQIFTNRLEGDVDAALVFDKVLLVDNEGAISVGAPTVTGASVKATIVEHLKGEKVIVFKKKRRKGYVKKNGHRQALTKVKIDGIVG